MRRFLEGLIAVTCSFVLMSAAMAQDAPAGWSKPLEGINGTLFGDRKGLGVMLVTPANDAETLAVEKLVKEKILASGLAELVMDDSPLGDIGAMSDEAIIAASKKYPIDVVVVIRTFPGTDGPTAVMRIETVGGEPQSFRLRPGAEPPWNQAPTPTATPDDDPNIAELRANDLGRNEAAMTRMGAVGVAETVRLVAAEGNRRVLTLESDPRRPIARDSDGDIVPWPKAYEMLGEPDLARRFRGRRVARNATIATGIVLAAAGVGVLFVGLANQANCAGDNGPGSCGRPVMIGSGFLSLGLGTVAVISGLLLHRHPISTARIEALVTRHNEAR